MAGIATVAGACLLMILLGCMYLWANINLYVLSYFFWRNQAPVDLSFIYLVDTALIASEITGYNCGLLLLQRRYCPKKVIALSCFVALSGFLLSSFCQSLISYLCCYSLLYGFGIGVPYFVCLVASWEYFP